MNDARADYEVEFSVDGTATFRMTPGTIATELTVFVPPHEPLGVYLLTVRNRGGAARRLRLAPYFQIVLADQPEYAGPLRIAPRRSRSGALFFENPRNEFRSGPAFVAMSAAAGMHGDAARALLRPPAATWPIPAWSNTASRMPRPTEDDRPIAGAADDAGDSRRTASAAVVVVLGQADDRRQAEAVMRKYRDVAAARASLAETRRGGGA